MDRRMKLAKAAALSVALLMPSIAVAQPLMENIATLAVASRWCKDYTVDVESGLKLALSEGMNPLKAPYKQSLEEAKEKLEGILAKVGVNRFCSVTYERYKPGGPVPGFMVKN